MEGVFRTVVVICSFCFVLSTKVPVLLWSPTRSLVDLPQSNAGKTIVSTDFSQQYLKPLITGKDGNLVVFLQDKLSLQDFTQHADVYNPESDGGAFKNVKGFMDELSSLSLPSVHLPSLAIDDIIKTFKGKVHQVKDHDASKVDLDHQVPNLIIVKLTSISESPNEAEGFKKNDEVIGKVTGQLAKQGVKYTALYTGQSSQAADPGQARRKRSLLSVDAAADMPVTTVANGTLFNSSCIMLYFRSINVDYMNTTYNISNPKMVKNATYSCDNTTASLSFNYALGQLNMMMDLEMAVSNVSGYWSISNASVELDSQKYEIIMDSVSAPVGFSYHCSSLARLTGNTTDNNFTVSFLGFQLQPFGLTDHKFYLVISLL
ncbi:V-type proton ATPase subunit S1-like isoform X2 [Crassostrea virginica]